MTTPEQNAATDAETLATRLLVAAARMETARVYGQLCPEHRSADEPRAVVEVVPVVDLEAARQRKRSA
jgi:hypothetical protein